MVNMELIKENSCLMACLSWVRTFDPCHGQLNSQWRQTMQSQMEKVKLETCTA